MRSVTPGYIYFFGRNDYPQAYFIIKAGSQVAKMVVR